CHEPQAFLQTRLHHLLFWNALFSDSGVAAAAAASSEGCCVSIDSPALEISANRPAAISTVDSTILSPFSMTFIE
ncbi:hypothetical protein PENTCL1PPCAC_21747, partial [Pristionchus entomophagus]